MDGVQDANDYTDTYTLDLVGNRQEKDHDGLSDAGMSDDEVIAYSYNARDQLLGEDSTINANDVTYGYDANGSQVTKASNGQTLRYAWDLHGRMVGIHTNVDADTNDLGEVTYAYNSDGVRVRQTAVTDSDSDGQLEMRTTTYLNDPWNPTGYAKAVEDHEVTTGDVSQAGTVDKSYILGLQVIGQADASAIYYMLLDGHGSTAGLTNASGTLVEEYAYSAFGEAIGFDANTAKTNWLFGGDGIWDAESHMTYHLARWRDGHRFVSYDSFEADPRSPAGLHKYVYASATPVRGWDPSGHFDLVSVIVGAGISSILGYIASPIIKPVMNYVVEPLIDALVPVELQEHWNRLTWRDLSAIMIGGSAGLTVQRGPVGVGLTAGAELLVSPKTGNWGVYGYAEANVSVFGSPGFGSSVKAGLVFNADTLYDYTGPFRSVSVGFGAMPNKWKKLFAEKIAMLNVQNMYYAMPSPSVLAQVGTLTSDVAARAVDSIFKTWDNKVVTFFWTPYTTGAFGISVESMFTKDGSTGFSTGLQEYWLAIGDSNARLK